ncbi:hypothetical protein QR680_014592 [Steinernema hermaphroditum]|uniref:RRM domain-containing protein n=1 Tax=Steinernema hermaphroditum TaxID=289476 RepID=A0AA39IB27_9BILA|nr:hypothetical protein QR680_014592 [Steinernema hermaphroditum]
MRSRQRRGAAARHPRLRRRAAEAPGPRAPRPALHPARRDLDRQAARHRRARRRPDVAVLDPVVTVVTVSVVAAQDLLVALAVELKLTQGEPVSLQAVEVRRRLAAAVAHLLPVAAGRLRRPAVEDATLHRRSAVLPVQDAVAVHHRLIATTRVCVRNLSRNITSAHLEEIFGNYGVVKKCDLLTDRHHPYFCRGTGFLDFENAEDADKAQKHMDGGQIDGLQVKVEFAVARHERPVDRMDRPRRRESSPNRYRAPSPVRKRFGSPGGRRSPPRKRFMSPPRGPRGGMDRGRGRSRSRSPRRRMGRSRS